MAENRIWVKVDLINGESYIGSVQTEFDTDDDIFTLLEEQPYIGLKLSDVHAYSVENGEIKLEPLENSSSIYRGTIIIPNIDNILTIKFLKEDSSIVKSLKSKRKVKKGKKGNVLKLNLVKKEKG